ncbi:3-oxoacyl-[acyl-carrier-protein] synthase III C-terminal domain-containing protein [Actinophytocola algeriensis]|uniref:3-oxoacyl-[acyl-carrier-protein] synthase-3 n=1 Tax=Actinophytocola algeriensis TaxID=1768010 RepID=A0A7W7VJ76_9PSEU|nr:3-oxoacyl-[acyl-carrier-protein] synthase III C-terminal domain-containing protein [Actinophytocola algeriensis]MBB4912223.1 3-oxoacyl-[acyl-carrier-protein] synthase-3 [Actinophytocola algeriensis]MBE1474261.1 3-oxoacyl-[acyl-carrier-protein] synthase-3 [Actinophytocola algeriensis]
MTALREIAGHLPDRLVPLEELLADWQLPASTVDTLRRSYGYSEVRRQQPGETLTDLLVRAAHNLPSLAALRNQIRYVLYARTVPVSQPHPLNPLPDVCEQLGVGGATAFAVTHHGCAAGLLAVDMAGRLLALDGDPDALALIVAAEQVFTLDETLRPEARIFGEASAACLVSSAGGRDRVLSYATLQRGDLDHWATDRPDHAERFAKEYTVLVAEVISTAAERAGLRVDELRLILPHNVNVRSWRKVCRQLGLPPTAVLLDNVPLIGHTFAADPFLNYRTAVDSGMLRAGDRYLMASAAYGAIFSAMVVEH